MALSVPGLGGLSGQGFESYKKKYADFIHPQAAVELNGKPFADKNRNMIISGIQVDLTCGFEASMATFRIYGVFDKATGKFRHGDIEKQVALGSSLSIKLGYLNRLETVFVGFVAGVTFGFDPVDLPYIEVIGMDVKGIMMSGSYAMQLSADSYGEAVKEILQRTAYDRLKSGNAITSISVSPTPDRREGSEERAETIEMVSESDYEFVVKAAKKFNFEFFTECGAVLFRKAKSNQTPLMELGTDKGLMSFEIGYSLTGMVETIETCSIDAGTGKLIKSSRKYTGNLFTGNAAKKLIAQSRHVYIDPTITSQRDADARAESLLETMSYRLGELRCECIGIPELQPGRFVTISGLGAPVDNGFYLTGVSHVYDENGGYRAKLTGCANEVKK